MRSVKTVSLALVMLLALSGVLFTPQQARAEGWQWVCAYPSAPVYEHCLGSYPYGRIPYRHPVYVYGHCTQSNRAKIWFETPWGWMEGKVNPRHICHY